MWAKHPEIARKWSHKYGNSNSSNGEKPVVNGILPGSIGGRRLPRRFPGAGDNNVPRPLGESLSRGTVSPSRRPPTLGGNEPRYSARPVGPVQIERPGNLAALNRPGGPARRFNAQGAVRGNKSDVRKALINAINRRLYG